MTEKQHPFAPVAQDIVLPANLPSRLATDVALATDASSDTGAAAYKRVASALTEVPAQPAPDLSPSPFKLIPDVPEK